MNACTINHVFYHQESEHEDGTYIVDVEGCEYLEAVAQSRLGPNEPVVESQIKDVGGRIKFKIRRVSNVC